MYKKPNQKKKQEASKKRPISIRSLHWNRSNARTADKSHNFMFIKLAGAASTVESYFWISI